MFCSKPAEEQNFSYFPTIFLFIYFRKKDSM